jgi:hypothetical protein
MRPPCLPRGLPVTVQHRSRPDGNTRVRMVLAAKALGFDDETIDKKRKLTSQPQRFELLHMTPALRRHQRELALQSGSRNSKTPWLAKQQDWVRICCKVKGMAGKMDLTGRVSSPRTRDTSMICSGWLARRSGVRRRIVR